MARPHGPGPGDHEPERGGATTSVQASVPAEDFRPDGSSFLREALRERLGRLGDSHRFGDGEVIFGEGDRGDSMYIVTSGEVELYFTAGRDLKRLGPGAFFGELALITGDHRRTATAVARGATVLSVIGQPAFETLLDAEPETSVELMRATCRYLLGSEQRLAQDLMHHNRELETALDFLRRTRQDLDTTELLARTDELTGLYNRRCLMLESEKLLVERRRRERGIALVLADLDQFKAVNDTFGHAAGDHVLQRFAAVLRSTLRQTDLPCRLGGDEFAVLLADVSEAEAEAMATRLLATVGDLRIRLARREVRISCSMGGCLHRAGEGWPELYQRADRSLYDAKSSGRNRLCWDGRLIASPVSSS